jgi:hypothetical protein
MAIRREIVELFEAIPERIEVSGAEPTWEVTGGSFESAVSYAQEAFDEAVVVDRRDRTRWWPRVTLTVTTDPELVAAAPPLESLVGPSPKLLDTLEADMDPEMDPDKEPEPDIYPAEDQVFEPRHLADEEHFESFLEEIFARQERLRQERARVPEQRRRRA